MSTFLKLVGSARYNSRTTGLMDKGDIVEIQDDAVAELMLEHGTTLGEGDDLFHKPTFQAVAAPKATAKAKLPSAEELAQRQLEEDELAERLAAAGNEDGAAKAPARQRPVVKPAK